MAGSAPGRARRPHRPADAVVAAQRGRRVPRHDDLRRRPRPPHGPGARRGVGAPAHPARPRPRRAVRDGDDGEAGRLGRAGRHHARRAGRRRPLRAHGPQVVLLVSGLRRLPHPRPGAGRPHLLPRRARAGLRAPAAQGQARHALAGLRRGRVPRPAGAAPGRGGSRRGDDHRDGHPYAARLHRRQRGEHAPRGGRGGPSRAPPPRVRRPARRAAAHGQRARRPGPGVRGRHRGRPPPRARLRRGGPAAAALRYRGAQVLGLQARDGARRGGARVPRRQRLRGGVADAAAPARRADQRHLGGSGERHVARRAARARARAGRPPRLPRRVRAGAGRGRAARRGAGRAAGGGRRGGRPGGRVVGAPGGRDARPGLPGLPAGPPRAAVRGRRVLRRPAWAAAGGRTARCRRASTARRSWRGRWPPDAARGRGSARGRS